MTFLSHHNIIINKKLKIFLVYGGFYDYCCYYVNIGNNYNYGNICCYRVFSGNLSSAINSPVKETDKLEIIISAVGNKAKDMLPSLGTAALTFLIGILITKSILRIFKKMPK